MWGFGGVSVLASPFLSKSKIVLKAKVLSAVCSCSNLDY